MKKLGLLLLLVTLLAGMSLAMELGGKTGLGLRGDGFSVRRFLNNSFGFDAGVGYSNSTQTGQADSVDYGYSLGGFLVKEIYPNTLLEYGVTLQGWQGSDLGAYYNGLALNPFIGGECFINDQVALDGKIFLGAYSSDMMGGTRTTSLDVLTGNLGAHIYF